MYGVLIVLLPTFVLPALLSKVLVQIDRSLNVSNPLFIRALNETYLLLEAVIVDDIMVGYK